MADGDQPVFVVSLLLEGADGPAGGEVVFDGEVRRQVLGDGKRWVRVVVTHYADQAALVAAHPERGNRGSMTLACSALPVPQLPAVEPGEDPFVMVHLMRFAEGGRQAMAAYTLYAGAQGLALGVRPEATFRVESTLTSDGRKWDEVRFNRFPSHATFDELRANQVHSDAQAGRAGALADTYALMVIPTIDRLAHAFAR